MKFSQLAMAVLLSLSFMWPATGLGAETITLTIRPELLTAKDHLRQSPVAIRNPFSWPADAPENLLFLKSAEQAREERIKNAFNNIRLGAILWNKEHPRAIINDIMVSEKETVLGTLVEKINRKSVLLRQQDMLYELTFKKTTINLESID